jgi:hypothetical protein
LLNAALGLERGDDEDEAHWAASSAHLASGRIHARDGAGLGPVEVGGQARLR